MEKKNMSFFARITHMIGFEVFGIIIFTPFAMLILNENILNISILAIVVSLIAMVWNFIYNYGFDLIENYLTNRMQTT